MKNDASKAKTNLGKKLFSLAIISDTHLNQGEAQCSSPYAVNRLANGRMRHVIRDLNSRNLAGVIHLGDLIHPVPALPDLYQEATQRFREQIAPLKHQIYCLPGNHDIGDKPNDWAPTGEVCEEFVTLWKQHFGAQYFSFQQQGCFFVGMDAQIINSGLACETDQKNWLEHFLETHSTERIFLNLHYPPYLTSPQEPEHYDNLAEPGRSWLLGLLEQYKIEALLAGHVHNFWYYRHAETDCYLLPSTAFVRQDYSEMYRIPPHADQEAGRNDTAKLGYFLLHVYSSGHRVEIVRTYGRIATLESPETEPPARITSVHPRTNFRASLGFDMRPHWNESVEIPPTGGLDEFDRKEIRNDYPLMALWEMGVRKLRIPWHDLANPLTRKRLWVLRDHGHEFTLFSYGLPSEKNLHLLAENQQLLSAWEIAYSPLRLEELTTGLQNIKQRVATPVYLSRLHSRAETHHAGEKYYHVINHGFLPEDEEFLSELLSKNSMQEMVAGFVFRVASTQSPWEAVKAISEMTGNLKTGASLHLRMKGSNPAEALAQEVWGANRIAEALVAACTQPHLSVFVDTFADNDRGYFVNYGVVDRLYNPRLGFHVVKHLYGTLNQSPEPLQAKWLVSTATGKMAVFHSAQSAYFLLLQEHPSDCIEIPILEFSQKQQGDWHSFNLKTGQISKENPRVSEKIGHFAFPNAIQHPVLLQFK